MIMAPRLKLLLRVPPNRPQLRHAESLKCLPQEETSGEWVYSGIEATIDFILQRARTHGPYDGIMAMSQVIRDSALRSNIVGLSNVCVHCMPK